MKKKKDLEKELKKYNIPFVKEGKIYYLWGGMGFPYTEGEAWGVVNSYRHPKRDIGANVKKYSNSKERAALRENLEKERFDRAEVRENKEDRWSWD